MSTRSRKVYNTHDPSSFDLWIPNHHDRYRSVEAEIEWRETPDLLVIKVYLPGFDKKDVKIVLKEGNVLHISGEKVVEKDENDDPWYHAESARAKFSQPFKLPENAVTDRLNAHMEHGLLTVTIPKRGTLDSRRSIHIS